MIEHLSPWYIDPRFVENDAVRQRVLAVARQLHNDRSRRARARERRTVRLLGFIFSSFAIYIIARAFQQTAWIHIFLSLMPLVIVVAVAYIAFALQHWIVVRRFIRQALREHGDERCVACGHPLRNLPRNVIFCPECGAVRIFEMRDEELRPVKLK